MCRVAVPARDGRDYVPVTIPATGEQRFAGMLRWTEGRLLSARPGRNQRPQGGRGLLRPARRPHRRDAQPGERLAAAAGLHAPRARQRRPDGRCAALGAVLGAPLAVGRRAPPSARCPGADAREADAAQPRPVRLQPDPCRHASRQHPGRRRPADGHRLRRCRLRLAPVRHRRRAHLLAEQAERARRSSAPSSTAIAPPGRSPTRPWR